MGVKLSELNVEVGDVVAKDQLLITFDTSSIESSLSDAQASLDKTNKLNQITQNGTNRVIDDTKRQADYTIDNAKDSVDFAKESYDNTVASLDSYRNQFANYENQANKESENIETLTKDIKAQTKVLATATLEFETAKVSRDGAVALYESVVAGKTTSEIEEGEARGWNNIGEESIKAAFEAKTDAETACKQAEEKAAKAQNKLNSLNSSLAKSQSNLVSLQTKLETLNLTIEKLEESVDQLKRNYDSAVKSYNNISAAQESALESAKDSAKSTELNLEGSTKVLEKQIETYTQQIENGKLYSPIAGTVTAINYKVGDTYQAGPVITIQDTSDFCIESEISEYNIADISLGQKVLIKTDATGDEEMVGTVIFVAPTATVSVNPSATYTVRLSIDNPSDRLRLDMSASLSIIVEEHENVLTVPYNTISTDENGNSFVLLSKGDGTFETVYIDVIMESNYYSEISSDRIKDGDTLQIIPSDDIFNFWGAMSEEDFIF